LNAYENGDYATALDELKPLAELGEADAQYYLSGMYHNGKGVN
jgi:TPR repeat protein